jgi:hypothetical protein
VIEAHEHWFYSTATLTSGTEAWEATPYDFPGAPAKINKILNVTDSNGRAIDPIPVQYRDYDRIMIGARNVPLGYWLDHNKLWVNAQSYTESLRVYSIQDDYYNNITFSIREGTGNYEEATATDYVGATRVLTINFATTPSTDSVYSSVSELPDGHNEVVAYGAAIRALLMDVAQEPKLNQMKQWYTKLEYDLIDYLKNRQIQSSRSVYMSNLA